MIFQDKLITEEEVNKYINDNNLSLQKQNKLKIDVLKHNKKIYSQIKKSNIEIEDYIKYINDRKSNLSNYKTTVKSLDQNNKLEQKKVCNIDVSSYLKKIYNCESLEELDLILPPASNRNIDDIINLILIDLTSNKILAHNLLKEIDINSSDYDEYLSEKESLDFKINYIKAYHQKIKNPEIVQEKVNNLIIFLSNSSDKNSIMNDIQKNVKKEQYQFVIDGLKTIKDGTFRGLGSYVSVGKTFKIRSGCIRIIFRYLKKNTIVVTKIMEKKFMNNRQYEETLLNRSSLVEQQKEYLLNSLEDKEMLKNYEIEYNKIIEYLSNNQKGGNNGTIKKSYQKKIK